jgi:hypothetical protein
MVFLIFLKLTVLKITLFSVSIDLSFPRTKASSSCKLAGIYKSSALAVNYTILLEALATLMHLDSTSKYNLYAVFV